MVPDGKMAEGEGFEPSRRFPAYTRSRRAPSTTRPPLHVRSMYPRAPGSARRVGGKPIAAARRTAYLDPETIVRIRVMLRFLLRTLGIWLLAGALVAVVMDGARSIAASAPVLTPLAEVWRELAPASLDQARFAVEEEL